MTIEKRMEKTLKRGLSERQVRRLGQWSKMRQNIVRDLFLGVRGSRKTAINLQCLECTGEQTDLITNCPSDTCPLYRFRPFQAK